MACPSKIVILLLSIFGVISITLVILFSLHVGGGKPNMKNLAEVSSREQIQFIKSFNKVLTDMDGVIWSGYKPLPGVSDCVNNLKKLGNSVSFVTNNAGLSAEDILKLLPNDMLSVNSDDIVNPQAAYLSFLRTHNFNKTLFVIGSDELKAELKKIGFKIAQDPPCHIKDENPVLFKNLVDDKEIGAVLLDVDVNINWLKLQKALVYLKRSDCLFVIGATDKSLPFPISVPLIGNHYFYENLKDLSGRTAHQMAKPSPDFCEFVKQKFSITNPKRVLFIGDTINEDMAFASNSGYQKLLVLTGIAKKEDINDWKYEEKYKPDYYIQSMAEFNLILEKLKEYSF